MQHMQSQDTDSQEQTRYYLLITVTPHVLRTRSPPPVVTDTDLDKRAAALYSIVLPGFYPPHPYFQNLMVPPFTGFIDQ